MKNKRKLGLSLLVVLIICSVIYFLIPSSKPQPPMMQALEPEVSVITIKKEQIDIFKELPARISSYKISQVRPQANGVIKKRLFEEGSVVKEGQALYQIDSSVYEAEYENAHALLKSTGLKKTRYKELLKTNAISKQEYDDAVAEFEQAKAQVKKANINLDYTKIYAPISGFIGKSNVTEGTLVSANQAEVLATITQLDPIFADIALPSKDLTLFDDQKNITATIVVNGVEYDNKGVFKFSENLVDESTDSINLRTKFSNDNKKLLPGMFVNVRLHLKPVTAITVPQRVTTRDPQGNLVVWVIDKENMANIRVINANKTYQDNWIVDSGLEEGDVVIYQGFQKIAPNTKVKTIPTN